MITLSGVSGKGTVFGTMYVPNRENSGKNYCSQYSGLDSNLPVSDWYLPPPNSVWYPVSDGLYGPRLAVLHVGDIQSVDKDTDDYNPCKHTTLRGDALYLGKDGVRAPYWRKPSTPAVTAFTACDDKMVLPSLKGRKLMVMSGMPANSSDLKVHGRNGDMVSISYPSSYDDLRYWSTTSSLCANIAPPSLQTTLLQSGELHRVGPWYVRKNSNNLVTDPTLDTWWFRTKWHRPDRTTFVREEWCEMHSPSSYTPASSIAWTQYPLVVEANHRVTTCTITHVQSNSQGLFHVKYDLKTELSWFGWIFPGSYKGAKTVTTTGLVGTLLILEPGLTTEALVDTTKADLYCFYGKQRAAELYESRRAVSARTAAVRDVQALESNWIENLAGVKGTSDAIKPLLMGYKAVEKGNLKLARKALAGAYLVYKYVIAPGIADVKDVGAHGSRILDLATFHRFSDERRRGMFTEGDILCAGTRATLSYFTTYHLRLKNNCFSQLWSALEKLGLDPSAGQLWDLIPYSFVVDWFVPVGDSLRTIDAYNSLVCNRDILGRIESYKVLWPVEEHELKDMFDGNICSNGLPIEYSWYDRRVYSDVGIIDPIVINSDDNGLSVSQMAQGAALLTQYKR